MKYLIFLFILIISVNAEVRTAASVAKADVVTAYNACVDGVDTLQIPAGTATDWTTPLVINKAITVQGAGIGVTIIEDRIVKTSGPTSESLFAFSVAENGIVRLTDLEIVRVAQTNTSYSSGVIQFHGVGKKHVVQRVKAHNMGKKLVATYGSTYGVFSQCDFTNNSHSHLFWFEGDTHYGRQNGNGNWENPQYAGTDKFWYVEDCTLGNTATLKLNDGFKGARYVFRTNIANESGMGHHGTESTGIHRAPRFVEVYLNRYSRTSSSPSGSAGTEVFDCRDGTVFFWGNATIQNFQKMIKHNSYRMFYYFKPWGAADGTMLWDINDISDTGTGDDNTAANDGVFCSGTTTSNSTTLLLEDNTKTWSPTNKWYGYTVRWYSRFTSHSSSTATTIVVNPDPGWSLNQWAGYQLTKLTTNEKGAISSNTSNTLTMHNEFYKPNFSGYTGEFELSRATAINGSGTNTLTLESQGTFTTNYTVPVGRNYEIRKVSKTLDQTGLGESDQIASQSTSSLNHQALNQAVEPGYYWLNYFKGDSYPIIGNYFDIIKSDRDFFYHKDGYTGSTGMGVGPISSRPASPTLLNTAWWATDQGSWNTTFTGTIGASSIQDGYLCEIVSVGTTNFTTIGAHSNTVGVAFLATGTGSGTGTVKPVQGQKYVWNGTQWNLSYTPYTYPHPLRDDAAGDVTAPTLSSASINIDGTLLNVIFSESVVGVDASDFALSGGLSLANSSGSGLSWTFAISPPATYSTSYTLSHTPDTAEDLAGNPLGSFSGTPVTNNTESPDSEAPTLLSATIDSAGTTLTLVYSEPVTGVILGDYGLSSSTLSNLAGSGATRTFTISPAATWQAAYTLDYEGDTEDLAGNPMLTINGYYTVNNTSPPASPSVRNPGKAKGKNKLLIK